MSASELVCQLSSALEGGSKEAELPALLQALAGLLDDPRSDAASELDEILMDAWPLLMAAAARSATAEAATCRLLAALAHHCTAREVFTLCMAALAAHLRWAQAAVHAWLRLGTCPASSGGRPCAPACLPVSWCLGHCTLLI